MSREGFEHILDILNLKVCSAQHTGGRQPITKRMTLYIDIWYLANSSTFRKMSDLFAVSQSTVHSSA
jgi:hypothetical protein